jgi:hypothetical protein
MTEIQKWQRHESARMHLERYEKKGDAFEHRIIALDEAWARAYQSEMKRQTNEWRHYGSPRKTKVRQNPSNAKVMVIFAYDSAGTRAVPQHRTVTGQYYADFLTHHLRRALRKKRPHFLGENTPIILHDNARPHVAGRSEPATGEMAMGGAVPSPIFRHQPLRF